MPLVGRQGELAELLRLLHDAVAGHGALAVVSGEAGLGKTRLVRELERHAQEQGVVVLSGAAVEDGPAYRPIAQALLPVLRSQSADRPLALRPYRAALGRLFPAWAVEGGDAPDRVDTDPALVLGEGILFDTRNYQSTHITGGTVMGADPSTSVVSPHLQHWDAHNLFVVGASVFAHNSGYNPTGPLAALALRVGDDIASYVDRPRML